MFWAGFFLGSIAGILITILVIDIKLQQISRFVELTELLREIYKK